jgi:hypothetical protein
MSISAVECHRAGSNGAPAELLGAQAAIDRLAEGAWRARLPAFDDVYATVYRAAEEPRVLVGYSRELTRDELVARWGPRPDSLNTAKPVDPTPLYLLLGEARAGGAVRGIEHQNLEGNAAPYPC